MISPFRLARYLTLRALSLCFCAEAAGGLPSVGPAKDGVVEAQTLRIGTLAPDGTSFHRALQSMGETWRTDSGGRIRLNIFAGGRLGGEARMVALIKQGALDGALLTGVGLSEIEPAVTGMQGIPMGFRNLDEVDYIGRKLQPKLEEKLLQKGFVVLFWVDAGWVRFFSKKPVLVPDDLRRLKLFTWAGNTHQVSLYRAGGFNPIPIETANLVSSMKTNMVEAAPVPPFFAMSVQLDSAAGANHMVDLNWAPLVGAFVVARPVWEKLPEDLRAKLRSAGGEAGREITLKGRAESDAAVAAMVKDRNLKVTRITPEAEAEWIRVAESLYPQARGTIVPAEIFDETVRLLKEYRAGHRD